MKRTKKLALLTIMCAMATLPLSGCFDTAGPLFQKESSEKFVHENQTIEPWVEESVKERYKIKSVNDIANSVDTDESGKEIKYSLMFVTLEDGTGATYVFSTDDKKKRVTLYDPQERLQNFELLEDRENPSMESITR